MSKNKIANKWNKQKMFFLLSILFLTTGNVVFSILCITNTGIEFIVNHRALSMVVIGFLYLFLCSLFVWTILKNKSTLIKILLSLEIFTLFCWVFLFVFQKTGFFDVIDTPESLQAYLESAGAWMPIFYVVLQYLQVILLPIPSVVSTVAGLALFGPFKTMIYSLLGILAGSITAFFIGRKLGYKAVAWLVGEENLKKWKRKLKGKDNLFLSVMFLLPLFPDDVFCFIAGLSSMSNRYFLIMITVTRVIGIAGTCYSFDFIPFTTWWGILIWMIFLIFIFISFFLIYRNMDRIQSWIKNREKKSKK